MMDFTLFIQKVFQYMQYPEQTLPVANDQRQALEIEKLRKAISDLFEAKRNICPQYQELAQETFCLELARQILRERQG